MPEKTQPQKKKYFQEATLLKQLCQLTEITSNDHVLSHSDCAVLVDRGLAAESYGFTIITPYGLELLAQLSIINPLKK